MRWLFALCSIFTIAAAAAQEAAAPADHESIATIPVATNEPDDSLDAVAEPAALDPITVTATRTARHASEVPASVSVVHDFDIEGRGAATVGQAVSGLPGVALEGGPRRDAEFINIRGLSGPRVLFIVDGARQNFYSGHRSNLLVEPELIKRIEVLRGPGSALWGSDAVGGVVAVTTRDAADFLEPGETLAARVRAGYDSAAAGKVTSSLGALRIGAFDAIADVSWRESDDYRLGGGEREADSASGSLGSLLRLSWLPAGPHRVGFDYQGFRTQGLSPSNPAHDVAEDNPLLDRTNDQGYIGARYGFAATDDSWLESAAISAYRSDLAIHEDRVDTPRRDETAFHTTGAHMQTSLALPADAIVTLGGELYRDEAGAERDGAPRPQFPDARRQVVGAFAQIELPVGPVSFVPGVRYDRYTARSNSDVAEAVDASAVSPKVGLVWRVGDGLKLRLSHAEGFRAPSLVELYSSGQHFLGNNFTPNPALRPERAHNIEAGVSWDVPLLGGLASVGSSIYRNRIRDFIELAVAAEVEMVAPQCAPPAPAIGCVNRTDDGGADPGAPPIFVGGTTTSRNLTDATLEGGEVLAAWIFGPARLSADFSRVRGTDEATGQPLSNIPADTFRTALTWSLSHQVRGAVGFTRALAQNRVPSATASQVTISPSTPFDELILSRFAIDGPEPVSPTPGYSLWSASLSWTPPGGWWGMSEPRLILGLDNLTDEYFREHLNSLHSPGRNVRLSLSSSF